MPRLAGCATGGWRGAGHRAQRQTPLRGECGGVFVRGLPSVLEWGRSVVWSSRQSASFARAWTSDGNRVSFSNSSIARQRVSTCARGAQPPVDAFDEGILRRLSRGDIVPVGLVFVGEGQDGVRAKLGAPPRENDPPGSFSDPRRSEMMIMGLPCRSVIAANSRATRAPDSDVSATSARPARVRFLSWFAGKPLPAIVDHGQRPEPPPIRQLIRHKSSDHC